LPPTLQIRKKEEKDLYPPLNPPKTKRMDLYSPPINKKKWTTHSSTILKRKKKSLYLTPNFQKNKQKKDLPLPPPSKYSKNVIWK